MKIFQELLNPDKICIRCKKTEPRFIVGFSLGSYFNENFALKIKEINGKKSQHLTNHSIKFSVRISCKQCSDIISATFKHWIAYFGTPGSILTDNGSKSNN